MTGLLAVHAHPDDETLSTGALLATWAAAGRPVTLVTCTRGERGEVIGAELAPLEGDGPALAAHRTGELAGALSALGVRDHVFLDRLVGVTGPVEDSGMEWLDVGRAGPSSDRSQNAFVDVPVDVAARAVAELVLDRRPDVVVGYEPGGGYGHPDHVHAHRVMQRAVELAAAAGHRVPAVLWAALPEDDLRSGYRVVAEAPWDGMAAPDPDGPLPSAAVPAEQVDVEVDVEPVLDRLLAAFDAHPTQIQAVRRLPHPGTVAGLALSNAVLQPVLARECYRFAPGRPPGDVRWPAGVSARAARR
ncbi:PIG-L family deacetylase [Actinotalea ferrariae]|uniref:PIG-L family deacetylase n=1 Tax=Actinotalea ferrariae TaxID=1386098 RepID=UPI001C8CEE71|nr:PIG-L family deacetylase [Actinotalea ferrariae]MBX9244163.1 PIG-L family deacetylase [Actinotalea ferrariae]